VYSQISGLVGSEAAKEIESLVQNAYLQKSSFFMSVIGVGTLVLSATVTFSVLQDSLNTIWKVKAHPERGIVKFLIARGLSLALVFAVGFLLIVSLVLEALLSALQNYIGPRLESFSTIITASQWGISLAVIMLLFAMMFKYLPDVIVPWKEVWKASLLTAVLFTIGRVVIGFYLGRSNLASSYGAAASVIIIMLWVNYSSLIFFLGAEWIYVRHKRNGYPIVPIRYAVRVHMDVFEEEDDEPGKAPKTAKSKVVKSSTKKEAKPLPKGLSARG
jgi:membrane protein